jgi:hypothetical protein
MSGLVMFWSVFLGINHTFFEICAYHLIRYQAKAMNGPFDNLFFLYTENIRVISFPPSDIPFLCQLVIAGG